MKISFPVYVDKFLCFDIFWLQHDRLSGHEWKILKTIPQTFREPVIQILTKGLCYLNTRFINEFCCHITTLLINYPFIKLKRSKSLFLFLQSEVTILACALLTTLQVPLLSVMWKLGLISLPAFNSKKVFDSDFSKILGGWMIL